MKKFSEIAKDDIHLAGEKIKCKDTLWLLEGASEALEIKNPLVKKYGGNYVRIYKTPI